MCGIAGYITQDGNPAQKSVVKAMCDRIIHRGPDSEGYFCDSHAAIGMRRLRIIDLHTGDQPMGNEDGTLQIVFNGEIYNYRELRAELIAKGHIFRTQSDTEVIVHLYEEKGERAPEYLNGMFAFVIWDTRRRELFAARDRFGKKPLYYSMAVPGVRFCFASELKALQTLAGFPDTVNARAVADFLALSYIVPPMTIFENVYRLQPGETITVTRDREVRRRYWRPQFHPEPASAEKAAAEIQELAADAVERRMISDVPLGAFLSGGVDSSAVVALMAAKSPGHVKTFSIGFTDPRYDELQYARMVATRYRTDHRELVLTPSVEDVLAVLIEHYDEPFADSSAIPMLYLANLTRKFVTVALSGDGADEVFGGYRRYHFGLIEARLRERFPEWFRRSVIRVGGEYYPKFDYLPRMFRAKTLLRNLANDFANAYFTSMATFPDDQSLFSILSPDLRAEIRGYSPQQSFADRFREVSHLPPLQQLQAVDFETYLPGDILVKADRATMAYSLESRSPWLDYRLAELACNLPTSLKIHRGSGKYIFKRAMAPHLPPAILTRTKMGFSVPLPYWFRSSLKPIFEAHVLGGTMERYVNPAEVQRLWTEHQSGFHDHSRKLWPLLMLASWDRRFNSSKPANVISDALCQ